jgi:predicted kinase
MLIVMQGPSGGGKSTKARELAPIYNAVICSTDDLFMENGVYNFQPDKLGLYHKKNLERATELLSQGISVIVDNTNIKCWQAKGYVQAALQYGHEVQFIRCNGQYVNIHGVPDKAVEDMRNGMEELTVESCLNSKTPWES